MRENALWYGYLEAGGKSSPVLRDPTMETGNPKTLYLFNLSRKDILEYRRDIVESKLRELTAEEAGLTTALAAGYAQAQRNFKRRDTQPFDVPEPAPTRKRGRVRQEEEAPAAEQVEETDTLIAVEPEMEDELEWCDAAEG